MNINDFYILLHIGVAFFTILIMLYLWKKYFSLSLKIYGENDVIDYSIFLFIISIVLWELNLFDSDMRFESYSSILLNSTFGVAMTSVNNNGVLGKRTILFFFIITIILLLLTQLLYLSYPENVMIGYMVYVFYMLGILIYSSVQSFKFYRASSMLFIGILTCFLFFSLFSSIVMSLLYSSNEKMFNFSKALYLLSSFGLFSILISYTFTWFMNFERKVIQTAMSSESIIADGIDYKTEIISDISKGNTKKAIRKMMSLSKDRGFDVTELIIQLAWLSRIDKNKLVDTIEPSDYRRQINTINSNVLSILNKG